MPDPRFTPINPPGYVFASNYARTYDGVELTEQRCRERTAAFLGVPLDAVIAMRFEPEGVSPEVLAWATFVEERYRLIPLILSLTIREQIDEFMRQTRLKRWHSGGLGV